MNRTTTAILQILVVISYIGQLLTAVLAIGVAAIGGLTAVSSTFRQWAFHYANLTMTGDLIAKNIVNCVFALLMIIPIFLVIGAIRKLIANIERRAFFVSENLHLLRTILIEATVFAVANILDATMANGFQSANYFLPVYGIYSLSLLGVLYVIYLVFKYGLLLQDDANQII